MKKSATITLELSAFELDLLKDSVKMMKSDREKAGDGLRFVRSTAMLSQLEGQENKF